MDNKITKPSGVHVFGVVISNTARVITRKDKSGQFVSVSHEIALRPGVAVWQRTFNLNDVGIKIDGETVLEFPKLKELQPIGLRLKRFEGNADKFRIYDAEFSD